MYFLWQGQFAWMAHSRCGLTNALYTGTCESDLFMKNSIPLASLVAVRVLAEGVNAEFSVEPGSLTCSHFCIELHSASSQRFREV